MTPPLPSPRVIAWLAAGIVLQIEDRRDYAASDHPLPQPHQELLPYWQLIHMALRAQKCDAGRHRLARHGPLDWAEIQNRIPIESVIPDLRAEVDGPHGAVEATLLRPEKRYLSPDIPVFRRERPRRKHQTVGTPVLILGRAS